METLFEILWWGTVVGLVLIPPSVLSLVIALALTYIKDRKNGN